MASREWQHRLGVVSLLEDPTRRALYDLVSAKDGTSRDEAAGALGLSRSTAAFHLDRMASAGLLDVHLRRLTGRSGPGAGRPAKLYSRSRVEASVSVPERRYDVAAEIFARAIAESARTGEGIRTVLHRVAVAAGREVGERAGSVDAALVEGGYEPHRDDAGGLVMGNCPFHRLAERHTDLVCELNADLLSAVAATVPGGGYEVRPDPGAGRCCVRVIPPDENRTP